jgi:translation initiation factor 5A
MEKRFVKVGQLREGNYVLIDDVVCQIKGIEKSKPGKHGAAKARITGFGVFDDSKRTLMQPTGDDAEVPIIEKGTAQVVAIMGDNLQLMDTTSYQAFDVPKPKDVPGIAQGMEVEYIKVDQNVRVIRKKSSE